jgi:hypothetical protein
MRSSLIGKLMFAAALMGSMAAPGAVCAAQVQGIPTMTVRQAEQLPPDQRPTIFRSPTNPYGYPYDIHETDGLSRNPDDCLRWGCINSQ